jgi:hypothetical protein
MNVGTFTGIKSHGFNERLGFEPSAACGVVPERQAAMGLDGPCAMIGFSSCRGETKRGVPAICPPLSYPGGPRKPSRDGRRMLMIFFEPPHDFARETFCEPCRRHVNQSHMLRAGAKRGLRAAWALPGTRTNGSLVLASMYEDGALAQCERQVSLDFASMRRDHERLDASQFPGGHDGKGMVATCFEAPEFDFGAGLPRQLLKPDAHRSGMAIACKP